MARPPRVAVDASTHIQEQLSKQLMEQKHQDYDFSISFELFIFVLHIFTYLTLQLYHLTISTGCAYLANVPSQSFESRLMSD